MKLVFIKNVLPLLFVFSSALLILSCSEDEIDTIPTAGLTQISEAYALGAGVKIELWGKEELFAGYNTLQIALYDSLTGKALTQAHIQIMPTMNMQTKSHSCPVEQPDKEAVNQLFPAAVLFTMPSGDMGNWTMEIKIHNQINESEGTAFFNIHVKQTTPAKVVTIQTTNGDRFYLSYIFPEKQKVGINNIEVIAFTLNEGEFVPAENLLIHLTPEMPAMDHGSPNNVNPIHTGKGHYNGKVNFTMTGEWRLHLELRNGNEVLGTKYFDVIVD